MDIWKCIESCIRKKDKKSALVFLEKEVEYYLDIYRRWGEDSIKGKARCEINKHKNDVYYFCPLIFHSNLFRGLSRLLKIKEAIEKEDWEKAQKVLNLR